MLGKSQLDAVPCFKQKKQADCEREFWGLPHGLGSIICKENQSKPACLLCEKMQKDKKMEGRVPKWVRSRQREEGQEQKWQKTRSWGITASLMKPYSVKMKQYN